MPQIWPFTFKNNMELHGKQKGLPCIMEWDTTTIACAIQPIHHPRLAHHRQSVCSLPVHSDGCVPAWAARPTLPFYLLLNGPMVANTNGICGPLSPVPIAHCMLLSCFTICIWLTVTSLYVPSQFTALGLWVCQSEQGRHNRLAVAK